MPHITLSGLVKRRFVHCVNVQGPSVAELITTIGVSPKDLCEIIAGHDIAEHSPYAYFQVSRWLGMPLSNTLILANISISLKTLVTLGMQAHGYRPTSTAAQIEAANDAGVSVAVFRRALHGHPNFRPSIRTCDRLAEWVAWSGFTSEDIALSAGMVVRYLPNGRRVTMSQHTSQHIVPYACACGRAGCLVPAHIPYGPRRKWRSDACRMWAKRRERVQGRSLLVADRDPVTPLPQHSPIVRFIMINERPVPLRF
jgi:hypothetical protein